MSQATPFDPSLRELPGGRLVEQGLMDLRAGRRTPEGLLLAPATRRLRKLGVMVPMSALNIVEPEIALYESLAAHLQGKADDPYFRYNSWRAELSSFVSALEHQGKGRDQAVQG